MSTKTKVPKKRHGRKTLKALGEVLDVGRTSKPTAMSKPARPAAKQGTDNAAKLCRIVSDINAAWDKSQDFLAKIGEMRNRAKPLIKRGSWQTWITENFPFSDRSARGYMALANGHGGRFGEHKTKPKTQSAPAATAATAAATPADVNTSEPVYVFASDTIRISGNPWSFAAVVQDDATRNQCLYELTRQIDELTALRARIETASRENTAAVAVQS